VVPPKKPRMSEEDRASEVDFNDKIGLRVDVFQRGAPNEDRLKLTDYKQPASRVDWKMQVNIQQLKTL